MEEINAWTPEQGKPKKWLHAYLLFIRDRKSQMMADNPGMPFKEMMGLVS